MSLLVNHVSKWAFIHVPKTAGTSISYVLNQYPETENIASHQPVRFISDLQEYFIFSFVRNPFTRTLSSYFHYQRKYNKEISFENFLKTTNLNHLWMLPQNYYLKSDNDMVEISFIGKYENLKKDVSKVFHRLGINQNIPHLNRHSIYDKHPHLKQEKYYKSFYTEDWMKDWVRERYKDDFKIFDYDMDI